MSLAKPSVSASARDVAPPYRSPLPRLRVGSALVTRRGIVFRVRQAIVLVAESGAESPSLVVIREQNGETTELLLTVGILANLTRGAAHKPGGQGPLDWASVPRRPLREFCRPWFQQSAVIRRSVP